MIMTTTKVKIQFEADASAAAGVRIANGAYSEGNSHGMASIPTAKKKFCSRLRSVTPSLFQTS